VEKAWSVQLHWMLQKEYSLGVRWQQHIAHDQHTNRWILQLGRLF